MSTYEDTIEYLYGQLPMFSVVGAGAYKPGLATAVKLSEAFGTPHKAFPTVHVAGTNGKGSTSNMLASILQEAGYRTGLYTSPHIFDFRERIRVDGEMIPRGAVTGFVDRYRAMDLDCSPSFFELTTIMAFDHFRSSKVDIAVIETGLGGRLDTTNIITPLVSVITNVSLDHMAQLGDSTVAIAGEKAGIIKPAVPVVVGRAADAERDVFVSRACETGSPIIFASDHPVVKPSGTELTWKKPDGDIALTCALKGSFQQENINTVLHAVAELRKLGLVITDSNVTDGLARVCDNTHFFGRWSVAMRDGVEIITDTGHNIGAWEWIAPELARIADISNLHIVLGFVADKLIEPIFRLLPANATYNLVSPAVKRARSVEDLAGLARKYGLQAYAYESVYAGCRAALSMCRPGDTLFIGGSNYLVAEILPFLSSSEV